MQRIALLFSYKPSQRFDLLVVILCSLVLKSMAPFHIVCYSSNERVIHKVMVTKIRVSVCVIHIQTISTLRKKHHSIAYHRCREAVAAGTARVAKQGTNLNLSDLFTKVLTSWFTY